jgi:hypothetical protein
VKFKALKLITWMEKYDYLILSEIYGEKKNKKIKIFSE